MILIESVWKSDKRQNNNRATQIMVIANDADDCDVGMCLNALAHFASGVIYVKRSMKMFALHFKSEFEYLFIFCKLDSFIIEFIFLIC